MPVGKSSIDRLSRKDAAPSSVSGILTYAPEVPVGDPATPPPAKAVEAGAAPTAPKKTPGRKPKTPAVDGPKAVDVDPKFPHCTVGDPMPVWLL